jgi:hypothetical protein
MARLRARYSANTPDVYPIIYLWRLGMVVALGGHRNFMFSNLRADSK